LPLITLIKNKIKVIKDFLFYLINKFKDKIYFILFGPRIGTFTEKGHLLFPIIILNNKLLLELTDDSSCCEDFFRLFSYWMFNIFTESPNWKFYEEKLFQLLQEKKEKFPVYFDGGGNYKKLILSKEFTLMLYKEWEKDTKFLTFVICYYLRHYVFLGSMDFDTDFMEPLVEREEYIKLDLSPFFIYQEQANSVADHLSIIFKEELTDLNSRFYYWIKILIDNLKKVNLPKKGNLEINKKTQIKNILLFILIINGQFIISILCDIFIFLVLGKYGVVFLSIFLYSLLNKLKYYLVNNISLKVIAFDIFSRLKFYIKSIILGILYSLIHPYLSKIIPILRTFPIIISVSDPRAPILLFQRELKNKINLLLTNKYLIEPQILEQKFKKDRKEILKGLGIKYSKNSSRR
jgi:hypothetical protein